MKKSAKIKDIFTYYNVLKLDCDTDIEKKQFSGFPASPVMDSFAWDYMFKSQMRKSEDRNLEGVKSWTYILS